MLFYVLKKFEIRGGGHLRPALYPRTSSKVIHTHQKQGLWKASEGELPLIHQGRRGWHVPALPQRYASDEYHHLFSKTNYQHRFNARYNIKELHFELWGGGGFNP